MAPSLTRALILALAVGAVGAATIRLSGTAPSQRYDGHGGLSAGASSRLLLDYPEPQRSQILDYLFLPSFGASLHVNKVEIGGDTQSTDGTEASYKHYREEVAQCGVNRGYEMWLLAEGYKRSPDLQSYILSWGVPNWVGNASFFSAENIAYQVGYAKCIRATVGGANPHYIGIWNERSWGSIDYVVSLRQALDAEGFSATRIVLPDGGDCSGVTNAAKSNATFAASVYAYGEHYPCKRSCPATAEVGLKFWASEDYSTVADWAGAGCWGRSLSQNWVLLNSTATISWSTIWSVYPKDSYFGNGLMYAFSPWSGSYIVNDAIWTSAHHTQFMSVGWQLLGGGSSGMLPGGGSYVAAVSPDKRDFTLVLETMQGNCLRCSGGATQAQALVFALTDGLPLPGAHLKAWQTLEGASFMPLPDVIVADDGTISVAVPADGMVTVSTITTARHGSFPSSPIPADAPFPLPYNDSFDDPSFYYYDRVPRFFGDQAGSFAVRHGVVQQVVGADPGPNGWGSNREPLSLLGDAAWGDVTVSVSTSFCGGAPDRGDGAPPAPFALSDAPAGVAACKAGPVPPEQRWQFSAVAPEYLSSANDPPACLNVPGCDVAAALIYYACVTTGCECGCPSFSNLQFALDAASGRLTTPMASGCVELQSNGALALKPCTGGNGQVWTHNATSRQLSVVPPGGGLARCLEAVAQPPPPPPPSVVPYAALAARVPTYDGGNAYQGYQFSVFADATFTMLAGKGLLGNGSLPLPFNSSAWHVLSLTAKGTTIAASVDGVRVFSGSDATYPVGQVALGSGYHYAAFDLFSVVPS